MYRVLVIAAVCCCGLVLVSFGLFALDQAHGASSNQVGQLVGTTSPPARGTGSSSTGTHGLHGAIDSVAGKLTSPFSQLVNSKNPWVARGIPTLIALLVYGFGLGYLARFSRALA